MLYSQVYERLQSSPSYKQSKLWKQLFSFLTYIILVFAIGVISLFWVMTTLTNPDLSTDVAIAQIIIAAVITILISLLIYSGINIGTMTLFSFSPDENAEIYQMIESILLKAKVDDRGQGGLTYSQIERLRSTAQDANSAWGNGMSNIVVIGFTTWIISKIIGNFSNLKRIVDAFSQIIVDSIPAGITLLSIIVFISFALINYIRRGISKERSNRLIRLACNESLAILDYLNLTGSTIADEGKRRIANVLPETKLTKKIKRTRPATAKLPYPIQYIKDILSRPSWRSAPAEHQAALAALDRLPDEALWDVARSRIGEDEMMRYELLLDRHSGGVLSLLESEELGLLRTAANRFMLRKAHAAALLKWRGHIIPPADKL